ncbi:hypothetical protein SEPCBS119000_001689 [Sporothrix epigloea]|uniref:DUF1275 domain protein n=1 Tax=Sporothrix epigloea TaxID=1892477 RepID=A0ABP0DC38_9PEZI
MADAKPQIASQASSETVQQSNLYEKQDVASRPQPTFSISAPAQAPAPFAESESIVWTHLTATIKPTFLAEVELILLTVFTGIQDAVSFPDYHCFASNQTGNTVFLMLALILPDLNGSMFNTASIGSSLGFFLAAGWLTGQLSHIFGPRNRLWLIVCNFLQAALVFGASAIQYIYGANLEGSHAVAVLALLAFASGSQVVQSRSLAMTEISTAMATAAWVDLLIDPQLFAVNNRPRTRRLVFLVALALGALMGAAIRRSAGSSVAILISGAGKLVVAFMYLFNEAEKPKADDSSV